jgi:glucose/arabinose dehydrogenase
MTIPYVRRVLVLLALALTALGPMPARAATAYAIAPAGLANVSGLTALTFHGGAMYATSYTTGAVLRAGVLPGGLLGPATPLVTNLSSPLGVAVGPDGTVFVADSHAGGTGTVGRVRAYPPAGGDADLDGAVVVDGLPNGRHNTNNLVVHGDRLYVTNGNSTDDGVHGGAAEQPLSGTILSVALTARDVAPVESADLVVEARGLRNVYDIAFRPGTDELWATMNGPDQLDPYGEDLLYKLSPLTEGTVDFGFPACVWGASPSGPVAEQNPNVSTVCDLSVYRAPEATLGLHVSADGFDFGPDGAIYVAEFGANGTNPVGHAVVRVPISAAGVVTGAPSTVVPAATPLDVAAGPLGLYAGDFGSGTITVIVPLC